MDPRLQRGVAAFNAGNFFEAHEIWEDLWGETVGQEKLLLQGLVQIAAGYAKVESTLRAGALKLLTRGLEHIRPFLPAASGLSLAPLVEAVAADVRRLQSASDATVSIGLVHPPVLSVATPRHRDRSC